MMDSFILLLIGFLGIFAPAIVLGGALGLLVGTYKLLNLTYNRLTTLKLGLRSHQANEAHISTASAAESQPEPPQTIPDPNWVLVAQCLIWGSCKPSQVQK